MIEYILKNRYRLENLIQLFSMGSASLGDFEILYQLSKGKDIVWELGTNIGTTAMLLSIGARVVNTVDVFENIHLIEDESQRIMYKRDWDANPKTYSCISTALLMSFDNIIVCQDLSYIIAGKQIDKSIDLVFIDADHSYTGVSKDYISWFPKIKIGGYIILHDIQAEGVSKFFDEIKNNSNIEIENAKQYTKYSTSIVIVRKTND